MDSLCTHMAPNRIQLVKQNELFDFGSASTLDYKIDLQEPNLALIEVDGDTFKGTWTMLTDQGLLINFIANDDQQ